MKTKTLPCHNCGKKIEVNIYCNRYFLCEECKNKGIKIDCKKSIEKRKQTCLRKYGVDHSSKSKEVQDKKKSTCLKKYGVNNPSKNKNIQNKRKRTFLEKYGVDSPFKNEKVQNKRKRTFLEKYGVDNPSKSKEVQDKKKSTWLEKYGVDHPSKSKEVQDRTKQTCLDRYGVDNPFKNENIKNKIKHTFLEKYGVDNPSKSEYVQNKTKQTRKNNFIPILTKMLDYLELDIVGNYGNAHDLITFKCRKCGHEFEQQWNRKGYMCPVCYPRDKTYSKGEKELCEFVKSLGFNVIENTKAVIPPLDIYIPEKNIAIEYNGLYWHSDEQVNKNYHLNKLNQCTEKNIRLIQVFEDEWIYKQDIVKARLKAILGKSEAIRIHARKCIVKEINSKVKNNFLEQYHIQGKDTSKINLGAFYNDKLVAVMTFSHGSIAKGSRSIDDVWELNRFCTNYNYSVPGIASKLLRYFESKYEWNQIYSYADLRWSTGDLYYKLGFKLDHQSEPNYWYVKDLKRLHRFGLRKKSNEPKDVPEWLLREAEGYIRIWDCGNLKFKKN